MSEKEIPCTVIEELTDKPNLDSSDELNQRIKINEHVKDCKDYNCYILKVERINCGLYP